jgi:hypothetical protein
MEKKVASFEKYEIFLADQLCLDEISRFIVKENYVHHLKTKSEPRLDADIFDVFTEENYLYSPNSKIYIARTYKGQIIGCIRSFRWDKQKILPIEKIYGINPLRAIHEGEKCNFWHIGRFAVTKLSRITTITLFKQLMVLAVKPIVEDKDSCLIAEVDSKLLKVANALGLDTCQVGQPINYLASETIPIFASKKGVSKFYSKYSYLLDAV